jgi:hypothetical protein
MSYPFNGFANVGRRVDANATTATTSVFPAKTGTTGRRSNILITNHDSTNSLYIYIQQAANPQSPPTISATSNNGVILPGANLNIPFDVTCDVFIASSAGTVAYTALEAGF